MTIPQVIPQLTPPSVASYNYVDIASGLGFSIYYGASTSLAAGTEYILTDQVLYSSAKTVNQSAATTTTITFTASSFNKPRTVKGTAFFSCGVGGPSAGSVGMTVTAKVQLWDGSVATDISSQITTATFTTGGGIEDKMFLLQIPLTQTSFKIGESLRLVVTFQTSNANYGEIGIDPAGRETTYITTNATTVMQLNVPFKIEI
jgi:hypothetical protein